MILRQRKLQIVTLEKLNSTFWLKKWLKWLNSCQNSVGCLNRNVKWTPVGDIRPTRCLLFPLTVWSELKLIVGFGIERKAGLNDTGDDPDFLSLLPPSIHPFSSPDSPYFIFHHFHPALLLRPPDEDLALVHPLRPQCDRRNSIFSNLSNLKISFSFF